MENLPIGPGADSGAIYADTQKIDSAATDGLAGPSNSLAYRVHEIEKHFHSIERWFGDDTDGTGSTANNLTAYQLTAGTGEAFGTEAQILGANDIAVGDFGFTPVKFDLHRLFVTASSANASSYIIQIWSGTSTFGAATLHSEAPYRKATAAGAITPIDIQMSRIPVAEKVWARVKSETNSATIDLILGVHAYVG